MVRQKIAYLFSSVLLAVLSACGGGGDIDPRTITRTTELPANFNCPQGEIRTQTGIDVNQNGLLEPAEVASDILSCQVNNGLGGDDGLFGEDKPE
jgi:hypothetical protein